MIMTASSSTWSRAVHKARRSDDGFDFPVHCTVEQEGREFAICTVVEVEGSSPAHASFKMVVLPDGTQQGTVVVAPSN